MDKKGQEDPFRADAAIVYRQMRDFGPTTAPVLADRCFPVADGPPSTVKALRKRALRRVFDSLVWMRHSGVAIRVVPGEDGSVFGLGADVAAPMTRKVALTHAPLATLSSSEEEISDSMDLWHGRK